MQPLDRVGLAAVDERPVRAYSLGMRQRLGLAAALLGGCAPASWPGESTTANGLFRGRLWKNGC